MQSKTFRSTVLQLLLWLSALPVWITAEELELPNSDETRYWSSLPSFPLSDITTLPITVTAKYLSPKSEPYAELKFELNRVVKVFRAATYSQYVEALVGSQKPLIISKYGKGTVTEFLKATNSTLPLNSVSPNSDFEQYWNIYVRSYNLQSQFAGYCPKESYIQLLDYTESEYVLLETLPYLKHLADTEMNFGILASRSFFEGDNDLENLRLSKSPILVAVIKLTLKTNMHDLAYPIMMRYYWSPQRHHWIQYDHFQLIASAPVHFVY